MNVFYLAITVLGGLFFIGSGVLLPFLELSERIATRRKVRGPTTPTTSATTPSLTSAQPSTADQHNDRVAA